MFSKQIFTVEVRLMKERSFFHQTLWGYFYTVCLKFADFDNGSHAQISNTGCKHREFQIFCCFLAFCLHIEISTVFLAACLTSDAHCLYSCRRVIDSSAGSMGEWHESLPLAAIITPLSHLDIWLSCCKPLKKCGAEKNSGVNYCFSLFASIADGDFDVWAARGLWLLLGYCRWLFTSTSVIHMRARWLCQT